MDREIEDVQRRVCEVLGVDLSALWEGAAASGGPLTLTHFYSAQEDLLPPMRGMSAQEYFPWLQEEMLAGRSVAVSSLEEFPEEAAVDRDNLRLFGVRSNLTVPMLVGGTANVGALGLNTTRAERDWPDALVKRLHLVAQVFANALARKRADEALRESEERLSLAADAAGAGLWVFDYSAGAFWVTGRTRAIFGFSPDEIITLERLEASVHPDDWELVRDIIDQPPRAGAALHVEYRIWPAEGGVRWVASTGRLRSTPAGETDRLMGVSIDISERKRAEEALLASEARLSSGAELAGLAFYEVDFGDGSIYVDDRFRELSGLPPDREQGLQPSGVLDGTTCTPTTAGRVLEARDGTCTTAAWSSCSLEYRLLSPSREQKWIEHIGRVARARRRTDTRSRRTACSATSRSSSVPSRKPAPRPEPAAHPGAGGGARTARPRAARRREPAARRPGDRRRPQRAWGCRRGAGDGENADGPRGADEPQRGHPLPGLPAAPLGPGGARAWPRRCGRSARGGVAGAGSRLSVDLDPLPGDLAKDAALCCFRVAQEALNNVESSRPRPSTAGVALRQMDGGPAPRRVWTTAWASMPIIPRKKGWRLGLASMRERVRLVDGTLDIESAPGRGTTVVAWVPAQRGSA